MFFGGDGEQQYVPANGSDKCANQFHPQGVGAGSSCPHQEAKLRELGGMQGRLVLQELLNGVGQEEDVDILPRLGDAAAEGCHLVRKGHAKGHQQRGRALPARDAQFHVA